MGHNFSPTRSVCNEEQQHSWSGSSCCNRLQHSLVTQAWINIEHGELDWKRMFTGLNAGFASSMPLHCRYSGLSSESCHYGHTPVQDRSKGKPQNGFRVAPEVHGYHNFRDTSVFLDSPSMLLSMTQEQNVPLWAYTG